MIKIAKKVIVRIQDIKEKTYDAWLDTEYREALSSALIGLGFIEDKEQETSRTRFTIVNKQMLIDDATTRALTGNELSEIIHLMMYKMRNDFQYGEFKPIALDYLEKAKEMTKSNSVSENFEKDNKKPKCNMWDAHGYMFDMICLASKTLKQNKMFEESREMIEKATMSYDYDDAYNVIKEYVELVEERQKTQEEEEEFE